MATVTRSEVTIEVLDHDGDKMQTTLQGSGATALTYADVANDANSIFTALAAIVDGVVTQKVLKANRVYETTPSNSSVVTSQTRTQWVLEMTDDVTGRVYSARLGTAAAGKAGVTTHVVNGVVELDLTADAGLALASSFGGGNFTPISPLGNTMTLSRVYIRDDA